jgi:glycosyltransferase involved in cell wall biosynthesis
MPTVSVIIPNYNHAPYLEERIQSVLNQTFQDFELIILDDKSSDNSKEIIERYRIHPKVSHIVYNHENSGSTFKQWQKGIGLAVGQWIWIAESDDVAETMFLEELLSKIDTHKNIVVAFCASMTIDKNSTYLGQESWAHDISNRDWGKDFVNDGVDEVKTQMFYKNAIPNASAVLFRKSAIPFSVFEEIVKMKFAGDWLFWIKLLENGNVAYSAKLLNMFRTHGNTTRGMKSANLERQRYREYFTVINYVKEEYGVSLSLKKHYWILREWRLKQRSLLQTRIIDWLAARKLTFVLKIVLALKAYKHGKLAD